MGLVQTRQNQQNTTGSANRATNRATTSVRLCEPKRPSVDAPADDCCMLSTVALQMVMETRHKQYRRAPLNATAQSREKRETGKTDSVVAPSRPGPQATKSTLGNRTDLENRPDQEAERDANGSSWDDKMKLLLSSNPDGSGLLQARLEKLHGATRKGKPTRSRIVTTDRLCAGGKTREKHKAWVKGIYERMRKNHLPK